MLGCLIFQSKFVTLQDTNSTFFQTLAHGNLFSASTPFVEHDILFHAKDTFPTGLIGPCKVLVGASATAATTQHIVDAEGQVVQTLQVKILSFYRLFCYCFR